MKVTKWVRVLDEVLKSLVKCSKAGNMALFAVNQVRSHDPGGKVRLPLQAGVVGGAEYICGGQYRLWLSRSWDQRNTSRGYALWIGMNPSTAEADVDDPTIRKEMHFTRQMRISSYVKCNVMDYRATNPKVLSTVQPRSEENLSVIVSHARQAERVICAWGALPKPLRHYADDVVKALNGIQLYCMKKTKDGSPHHPLYLPYIQTCIPWP
jgi:hypothetical protein